VSTELLPPVTELKPIPDDHREGLDKALAQRAAIEAFAAAQVKGGLRNLFLIGSGGGLLTHEGLQYLLETRSTKIPTFAISANEFIFRSPAALGPGSLVVLASNTGTTPEVVEAAKFAKSKGASVASTTRLPDSALAQASDVAWTYDDDKGVGDPKGFVLAILGCALLRETGEMGADEQDSHIRTLQALPDAMLDVLRQGEALNRSIAEGCKDAPVIYIIGAGPNHGTAYCLSMCYLQEMQWRHAASFDAAEFLHGAMEVVVDDQVVIQFLGEEATRPIDERAQRFLKKYTTRGFFVDSKDFAMPGVDDAERPFASHFVLDALMSRLAQHFEAVSGFDLKNRHYMFKVEY
jgi:fructoselysine 6-phosphate deglycase